MVFDNVIFVPYGSNLPIIKGMSFKVEAGQIIGIIGKSGSGKTTIARLLTNIFETTRGNVLIDLAPLKLWRESQIGGYIGYVPQDVELFQSNIKDNISRFDQSFHLNLINFHLYEIQISTYDGVSCHSFSGKCTAQLRHHGTPPATASAGSCHAIAHGSD